MSAEYAAWLHKLITDVDAAHLDAYFRPKRLVMKWVFFTILHLRSRAHRATYRDIGLENNRRVRPETCMHSNNLERLLRLVRRRGPGDFEGALGRGANTARCIILVTP